jgi:hypothetical protein
MWTLLSSEPHSRILPLTDNPQEVKPLLADGGL